MIDDATIKLVENVKKSTIGATRVKRIAGEVIDKRPIPFNGRYQFTLKELMEYTRAIEQLARQAQREEDTKDAARYRWLVNTKGLRLKPEGAFGCCNSIEETNAAIDEAIRAAGKENKID